VQVVVGQGKAVLAESSECGIRVERGGTMKPVVSGGRVVPPHKQLNAVLPSSALREFVPLSDLTESLLSAYDQVAHRAYDKFMDRGAQSGSELEDWLDAEQEILGLMEVDIAETAGFVTALATLPGYRSAQVTLGIEPRWLLIFGYHEPGDHAETHAVVRSLDPLRGPPRMDAASLAVMCAHASRENFPARTADPACPASHLFCIMELPAEVDPARCTAILSNGLLGIRIPKAQAKKIENPKNALAL
jgi:HSP20 family molecular chaperone IbpA